MRDFDGVLFWFGMGVAPQGVDGNSELPAPRPENWSFMALEEPGLLRFLPECVGFRSEASISCCCGQTRILAAHHPNQSNVTHLESELGLDPLNLLTGIFLDLCLRGLCRFFSSLEAFRVRIMFFRKLLGQNVS